MAGITQILLDHLDYWQVSLIQQLMKRYQEHLPNYFTELFHIVFNLKQDIQLSKNVNLAKAENIMSLQTEDINEIRQGKILELDLTPPLNVE